MQNLLPIKLFCEEYNIEKFRISTDSSFNFRIATGIPKMAYQTLFIHVYNKKYDHCDSIEYDPDTCATELKNMKDWALNPEFFNSLRFFQQLYKTTSANKIQSVYDDLHANGIPFIDTTWQNFLYQKFYKPALFNLMKVLKCDTLVDLTRNTSIIKPFSDLGFKINNKIYYLDSNYKMMDKNKYFFKPIDDQSEIIYPNLIQQNFDEAIDGLIELNYMIFINEITLQADTNIFKYYKINFEH